MTQVSGVDAVCALYDEDTWGEDPGVPAGRVMYFRNMGLDAPRNQIKDETFRSGRGVSRPGRGNFRPGGPLSAVISPETIGFWLKHLIATPTTTGTGPYQHVFVPGTLPAGFIVEPDWTAKIASKVERYNGCRLSSANLAFPQEGFSTIDMQVAAKRHSINASALDASLDDPGHNGIEGFSGIVKVGGSQISGARNLRFAVRNDIDEGIFCYPGSGEAAGVRFSLSEGEALITGEIELVFQDFTYVDLAVAGTDTQVEIVQTIGGGDGTAGNEKIAWLVDHSEFAPTSPKLESKKGIVQTFAFQAFASGSDLGFKVTLDSPIAAADL